jgi:hypothetical protein
MTLMLSPLVLALSAFTAFQQPAGATVTGQVRSTSNGAPLEYARVEVLVDSRPIIATQTDARGVYVLRNVPLGRQTIRARHLDHAPLEVEIVLFGPSYPPLDFELDLRPVSMPFVTGRATRTLLPDTIAASNAELSAAAAKALEATPGVAELGLAEAARDIPGREPIDPADVLWVRGGTADLKLVLLNGAPVYAPFHIGGLIHALDADILRSANLYLGGAPAKYDGGLSYVLDMETRSGRTTQPHARVAVDMLAAEASVEGPVGNRIAYLGSTRNVHGLGTGPFFQGDFPYGYGDALGRVDVAIGQTSGISAMGFWNHERIRIDSTAEVSDADWGNTAGSLRYIGTHRNTNVLLTVGGGHFQTQLPLGGLQPLLTIGISDRSRFAADLDRSFGPVRVFFGASHDRLVFEYQAVSQIAARDSVLVRSRAAGNVTGSYVEGSSTLFNRVQLRGGLRADVFSLDPHIRIAPRLSATMLLTDGAALTLAAGQYRQYVRAPSRSAIFLGTPIPDTTSGAPLVVAKASHVTMSLTQQLLDDVRLGVEGYYKEFTDIPSEDGDRADASGVDLWVRRSAGNFRGWLGYSLAWVWSVDQPRNSPRRDFAGRQLVNVGIEGPIAANGRFDIRVSYGAGLPYTAVPEPDVGPPVFSIAGGGSGAGMAALTGTPVSTTQPADSYLRVDAEIAHTWTGSIRGSSFTVMPYVRVLNALNRRDALFYRFDRASNSAEPLGDLPVLPLIGMEWRF